MNMSGEEGDSRVVVEGGSRVRGEGNDRIVIVTTSRGLAVSKTITQVEKGHER